ncbi:transposase family protein [Candidatus Roizmanbacteria bacterium]|nr:transposase family protein [Candidatus Roizmanbacteria bacterium]
MKELITKLKKFDEIKLYGKQEELLCKMKESTIERLLESSKDITSKEYGLSGTRKSPLLKSLIPVRVYFTKDEYKEPGHIEMDCVLHCGESLVGVYAETLNVLDVSTHWNEKTIFLHKTQAKIVGGLDKLKKQFPFPLLSVDFDNGTEFVNWKMKEYCDRNNLEYTRCRSYHKNDQAHIEGKNYHSIRKVVGYDRIEDSEIVALIDDMYQNEHRLLTNFFYTTMKLKEKEKAANGHTKKVYEAAQTPYERVLATPSVTEEAKQKLRSQYDTLNPAELQRNLKKKLDIIYRKLRQKKIISSVTPLYHATPLPDFLFGNT